MTAAEHYTFGDSELAARRLARLAEAFAGPSRELLERARPERVEHAVDIGSGPGHTTRLLHQAARARRTTGMDASAEHVERARASATPGVEFVVHDACSPPFPVARADLLFSRFLLTHVSDPARTLAGWLELAAPRARLVLQETAALVSGDPTFARYYELVGELQRHYGQALDVGAKLKSLVQRTPWRIVSSELRTVQQPASVMAELHAMNLATWRADPYAREHFDPAELDRLEARLHAVARGELAAPPITHTLGEVVARAPHGDP